MAVEKHIVVQTCAKIASDLTVLTGEKEPEAIVLRFTTILDSVLEDVLNRIQAYEDAQPKRREIPVITQDEMAVRLEATKAEASQGRSVKKMKHGGNAVVIKGSTEQPPAWLIRAAAKAGVTEVWDNRGNLKDNPKRPHFVSTDESKQAFWPPKSDDAPRDDGSLAMPINNLIPESF